MKKILLPLLSIFLFTNLQAADGDADCFSQSNCLGVVLEGYMEQLPLGNAPGEFGNKWHALAAKMPETFPAPRTYTCNRGITLLWQLMRLAEPTRPLGEAAQHWSQILSNCHVFDQPLPPEALQQAFLTKEKVLRDCFSATKTLEQKPHHHIPELFNQNYRISDFLGMLSGELSHEGKTSHIVEVCSLSQTLIESPYASQQRHNAYHHNHYRDPDTPLPILPDAPVVFDGAVAAILQLIHEQRKVFFGVSHLFRGS